MRAQSNKVGRLWFFWGGRCSRISGGTPEARSRLCVCRASFLMTFVMSGMSLTGSRQLGLCFHCRSTHSVIDLGTKILHATGHGQKKKKERNKNPQSTPIYSEDVYSNLAEIAISKHVDCYPWKHNRPHFLPYSNMGDVRYGYVGHFIANRGVWKYVVHF